MFIRRIFSELTIYHFVSKGGETREERNARLLNALRLRGNKSYKCFRELMYRTGNFFVADLLWEEGLFRIVTMLEKRTSRTTPAN